MTPNFSLKSSCLQGCHNSLCRPALQTPTPARLWHQACVDCLCLPTLWRTASSLSSDCSPAVAWANKQKSPLSSGLHSMRPEPQPWERSPFLSLALPRCSPSPLGSPTLFPRIIQPLIYQSLMILYIKHHPGFDLLMGF